MEMTTYPDDTTYAHGKAACDESNLSGDQFLEWLGRPGAGPVPMIPETFQSLEEYWDNSIIGLHCVDPNGTILWANAAVLELMGYAKKEYIGQKIADFHVDGLVIEDILERLTAGETLHSYPAQVRAKDGTIKHVLISSDVYRRNGKFVHTRCFTSLVDEKVWDFMRRKRSSEGEELGFQKLLQTNELLLREIVQRENAEEQLRIAMHAAELANRTNRAKSEFLTTMSHELRTPLSAIIGFAQLLTHVPDALNVKQAQYVDHILTGSQHLLELINDILDLSTIEAGRLELQLEEFDVVATLRAIESIVKPVADKQGVSLALEVEGDRESSPAPIKADPAKFKQIFYNLLGNSVKFTPEGGRVMVKVSRGSRFVRISVVDTGIGINAEDQERVFEPFTQLDSTYARQQQGTGLGLSLTRKLVELHGGRIRVASEGEGKGSCFTIELPEVTP